jgi:hypothetical protein
MAVFRRDGADVCGEVSLLQLLDVQVQAGGGGGVRARPGPPAHH